MSEVPKLQHFNKKTGPPKWPVSFYIVFKKWVFQAHRRVPPTTGVVELWKKIPRTQKMFNLLGFTHVFDMGISLFLWHLLWHCLCTPKFYPKYFYPKYSKFFFSVHTRRVEIGHILSRRSWLYIYIYPQLQNHYGTLELTWHANGKEQDCLLVRNLSEPI